MTFFKRLFSALIACMLVVSMGAMVVFAEGAEEVQLGATAKSEGNLSKLGVLSALGIQEKAEPHMVTRAEFMVAAAKLINCNDFAYNGRVPYTDVPLEAPYYGAVNVFYELGILSESAYFAPNRVIGETEALKILVSALGYELESQAKGGYPGGYLAMAAQLGFAGFLDSDAQLSYAELIDLLYKSLSVRILTVIISTNKIEKADNNQTALNYYHKLNAITGQVTANKQSGLLGATDKTLAGFIRIDRNTYRAPEKAQLGLNALNDYLGYRVKVYVSAEDNRDQIVAYEIAENKTLTLSADEVDGFANFQVISEDKSYSLDRNYQIIYNGVATGDCTEADLLFEDGYFTLLDTDMNSHYDMVFVWRSEYVLVNTFSVDGSVVTDSNNQTYGASNLAVLCLNDNDTVYDFVIDSGNGERTVGLKELSKYPTLSVWLSRDGSYMKVMGYTNTVKGVLSAVSSESVTLGDKEIEFSEYALNLRWIPSADEIECYLTPDGKLLATNATVSTMKYGYIMQLQQPKNFSGYKAYMLLASGEKKVMEVSDKLTIDGTPYTATDAYNGGLLAPYQLVRYYASDDKIRKLDLESTQDLDNRNPDPYNSLRAYFTDYTGDMTWYTDKMMAPFCKVNTAIVFNVPEAMQTDTGKAGYIFNEGDFFVRGIDLPNEAKLRVRCYDYKDSGDCGALVRFTNENPEVSLAILNGDDPVAVVDKVVTSVNADGDSVRRITLVRANQYKTYYFSTLLEEIFTTKGYTVVPGDIVRFEAIGDTLSAMRVEYSYTTREMNKTQLLDSDLSGNVYNYRDYREHTSYGVNNVVHYYLGHVYNVTKDAILVRNDLSDVIADATATGAALPQLDDTISPVNWADAVVFRFDSNMNCLRPVNKEELITEIASSEAMADRIVAVTRRFQGTSLIVIYDAP